MVLLRRVAIDATSSATTPSTATPIANSHARMRPVSPMFTQSDTAPMVQKLVLLVTAPSTTAAAKIHSRTWR